MDDKKLKVLFFPAWFPNSENPLAGYFVLAHAKLLLNDIDVTVYYVHGSENQKQRFSFFTTKIEGVPVYVASYKKIKGHLLKPLNAILYGYCSLRFFIVHKKQILEADLRHVHVLTRAAILPLAVKLFFNKPFVISEHWSRYFAFTNAYSGFLRKLITRYCVAKSSGMSAVSNTLKEALLAKGLSHLNFPVISNAVDLGFFVPPLAKSKSKVFKILNVSGLNDHVKNIRGLLRAIKQLEEQCNIEFELDIVGDDDLEGPLHRAYAKELGLRKVFFSGKLYGNELLSKYQQADVMLLFSNVETFGLVVPEALSCGLPVITTKVGVAPELINENNGVLVDVGDENQLFDAVKKVMAKEYDRFHIRSSFLGNFSNKITANMIIEFYQTALTNS